MALNAYLEKMDAPATYLIDVNQMEPVSKVKMDATRLMK